MSLFDDKINTLQQSSEDKINRLTPEELKGIKQDVIDSALVKTEFGAYEEVNGELLPYIGRARTYYSDTTNQGMLKEGLATDTGGFAKRYDENSRLGVLGVTPQNGADLEVLAPYDVATQAEYQIHSNKGMIENRAAGLGKVDQSVKDAYGPGYTEYYKKEAPLYNPNYQQSDLPLPEGTWIPDAPKRWNPEGYTKVDPHKLMSRLAAEHGEVGGAYNGGIGDPGGMFEVAQTIASAASGVLKGGVELVDAVQELATWAPQAIYNKITGENYDIDLIPNDFKKSVKEGIDSVLGYDAALDQQTVHDITKLIDETGVNLFDPSTYSKVTDPKNLKILAKAAGMAIANPSLISGMITEIVGSGLALGAVVKVGSKIGAKIAPSLTNTLGGALATNASRINTEMKALKESAKSEAEFAAGIKILEEGYTTSKKSIDMLKGSIMTNADMASRMNQWVDEYKENNNEQLPEIGKLLQMGVLARMGSTAEVGSMKLSFGVKNGVKQLTEETSQGLWNGVVNSAKHLGVAIPIEGLQETFEGILETVATKEGAAKYENKTVGELLEAESSKILAGTILGAAGGGLMGLPKTAHEISKPAFQYMGEKIATATGRPADPTATVKPVTMDQKFNMWESVGQEGFDVDNPESKKVYTEAISEFLGTMLVDENAAAKYVREGMPFKNFINEAIEKVAKINGLTSPEFKGAAGIILTEKLLDYANQKDSATGKSYVPTEKRETFMKELSRAINNEPGSEQLLLTEYETQLKSTLDNMLTNEQVEKIRKEYGLDATNEGILTAKLIGLDKDQYGKLISSVKSMKVLGSKRLDEKADEIESALGNIRANTMGSKAQPQTEQTATDETKAAPRSAYNVSEDIMKTGFIGDEANRKSIKAHGEAINAFVGVEGINPNLAGTAIAQLESFVEHRGIGKIKATIKDKTTGSNRLVQPNGMRRILNEKIRENAELQKIIDAAIDKTDPSKFQDQYQRLTEMKSYLTEAQADHVDMVTRLNSQDMNTIKELYRDVHELSGTTDVSVLEELMKGLTEKSISAEPTRKDAIEAAEDKSTYAKAKEGDVPPIVRTPRNTQPVEEVKAEPKVEEAINKKELYRQIRELLKKEAVGDTNYTASEQALIKNYTKEINAVKQKLAAEKEKTAPQPKEVQPIVEEVSTSEAAKEGKLEVEEKSNIKQDLNDTIQEVARLEKLIEDTISQIKKLSGKSKVYNELRKEYAKDIYESRKHLQTAKEKLKRAGDTSITKMVALFVQDAKKYLGYVVRGLKSAVTKALKKLGILEEAKELTKEEIASLRAQIRGLGKSVGLMKQEAKELKTTIAKSSREQIEANLGELVTPNTSTKRSLNALLSTFKDSKNVVNELMKIMPTIVTKNKENGEVMVGQALQFLKTFSESKYVKANTNDLHLHFPNQATTNMEEKIANPFLTQDANGKNIEIAQLWSYDEAEATNPDLKAEKNAIRAHIKQAINLASIVTLKEAINLRTLQSDFLDPLIESTFAPLFTKLKKSDKALEIKELELNELMGNLKNAIRRGEIVPESILTESAGRFVVEQLELKLSKKLTQRQRDRLIKAFGALAVNNLLPTHIKQSDAISKANVRNGLNGEIEIGTQFKEGSKGIKVFKLENVSEQYQREVQNAGTVFEFASEKSLSMISHKPVKASDSVKNSKMKNSKKMKAYLDGEGATPQRFSKKFKEHEQRTRELAKQLIADNEEMALGKTEDEVVVELMANAVLGLEENIAEDTSPQNFKSVLAKYEAEKLTISRMLDVYKMVGLDEFYIGWASTVSGRAMMDNNMINMQSSGISRFIVNSADMETKLNANKITDAELDHVKLGMAQAVGIGIDKKHHTTALEELTKKFVDVSVVDGKFKLKFPKTAEGTMLKELVYSEQFMLDRIRELQVEYEVEGIEANSKSIMHLVQAVDLLRDMKDAKVGDVIDTNLALEADGITNGMMLLIMQMGWDKNTKPYAQKGGIYESTDTYKNHGEFKSDKKNKDIYETPVTYMERALGETKYPLLSKVIDGKWRNFLKDGVMTFIYGSSTNTIRANLSRAIVVGNSYIPGALSDGKLPELLHFLKYSMSDELLLEQLEDFDTVEYKKYVKTDKGYVMVDAYTKEQLEDSEFKPNPKFAYLSSYNVQTLIEMVDSVIGDATGYAFNMAFEPILKFRQALKSIEQINYTLFSGILRSKIKDVLIARGSTEAPNVSALTPEELTKITEEMVDEGTWYSAQGAEGSIVDYFKTEAALDEEEVITVRINTQFQSNTAFPGNFTVKVHEAVSNVGAVGVTTTHNLDGTIMVTGKRKNVLNIYDAIMAGVDLKSNTEQIQALNEAFYKVSTGHSMLGAALQKFDLMYTPENIALVDNRDLVNVVSDLERIFETTSLNSVLSGFADIPKTLQDIHQSRENMVGTEMTINQYMGATDVPGWVGKVDSVAPTIPDGVSLDKVGEGLTWLVNSAIKFKSTKKDRANELKVKQAKISGLETLLGQLDKGDQIKAYQIMREVLMEEANIPEGKLPRKSEIMLNFKNMIKESC